MDLRLSDAQPTHDERSAVDALLGAPASGWDGGLRGDARDMRVAIGGQSMRARRHLLLPALNAVQSRVGWISEGALNHVCARLDVPPAEAWGVATFYALLATAPRPRRVLHVCDDIACRVNGAEALCSALDQPRPGGRLGAISGAHVLATITINIAQGLLTGAGRTNPTTKFSAVGPYLLFTVPTNPAGSSTGLVSAWRSDDGKFTGANQ